MDGIDGLPIERKKTVVFDRLMMKLGKVQNYWEKVEKMRDERKAQLAGQLLENKDGDK